MKRTQSVPPWETGSCIICGAEIAYGETRCLACWDVASIIGRARSLARKAEQERPRGPGSGNISRFAAVVAGVGQCAIEWRTCGFCGGDLVAPPKGGRKYHPACKAQMVSAHNREQYLRRKTAKR